MATVYGSVKKQSSSYTGGWRSYLTYSTSTSNTAVTITCSGGVGSYNWGFAISSGITYTLSCTDMSSYSGSGGLSSGTGATKNKQLVPSSGSKTYTIKRGTSAKSVTLKCVTKNASGYINGTSTASTTISIPALASYKVSYNANGGEDAPSSQTKYYGKTLTLTSEVPTRSGYTFAGWSTSASGSVKYASGASYTSNEAVTLYAVWTQNTFVVLYDANGGEGAPDSQTKTTDVNLTLSDVIPTRDNFTFLGWAASETATTIAYAAGDTYTVNASITLYAVWTATCTIAYDMNGGEGYIDSQIHTYNTTTALSSDKPTRDSCVFLGWSADGSATTATYKSSGKYVNNEFINGETITLYAIWKKIQYVRLKISDSDTFKGVYVNIPDDLINGAGGTGNESDTDAYAVCSEGEGYSELYFVRSATTIAEGDDIVLSDGRTQIHVAKVYSGIETLKAESASDVPWYADGTSQSIVRVFAEDTITPVSMAYWFYEMTRCTQMDLTNIDTKDVTSMAYMCYACDLLEDVRDVSGWDTSNVVNMHRTFALCPLLVADFSAWDVTNVTDHDSFALYALDVTEPTWVY